MVSPLKCITPHCNNQCYIDPITRILYDKCRRSCC
jgi:hypothetical protein